MSHHTTYRPIAELAPYARNARTHSDAQLAQLASAIEEFGWTNPVLADAQGIVAGHGRVMAAQRLYARGLTLRHPGGGEIPPGTVPVIDCTGWSDTQRRAYILADNQLALQAGWDETLLAQELADLQALDCDLGLTGFGEEELEALLPPPGEVTGMPELPSGEKAPFEQMTFTVHTTQADAIRRAIVAAKAAGPFSGTPNQNSNGNAIARICEAYTR